MKLSDIAIAILLATITGSIGYVCGELHPRTPKSMAVEEMPPLEYFASSRSFSEIENAKTALEALCNRYVTLARSTTTMAGRSPKAPATLEAGEAAEIQELEEGVHEFQGTDFQLVIIQDLLRALKRSNQCDQWLNVYLTALYEHPTDALIGRFDSEAVAVAEAVGRSPEVVKALRHVSTIPLDFKAKDSAKTALARGQFEIGSTLD